MGSMLPHGGRVARGFHPGRFHAKGLTGREPGYTIGGMAILTIRIDIRTDPTLTDPHEVADNLLENHFRQQEMYVDTPYPTPDTYESAEWEA